MALLIAVSTTLLFCVANLSTALERGFGDDTIVAGHPDSIPVVSRQQEPQKRSARRDETGSADLYFHRVELTGTYELAAWPLPAANASLRPRILGARYARGPPVVA